MSLFDLDRARRYAAWRMDSDLENPKKWEFIAKLDDDQLAKVIKSGKTMRGVNLRMSKIANILQDNSQKRKEFQLEIQQIVDSAV